MTKPINELFFVALKKILWDRAVQRDNEREKGWERNRETGGQRDKDRI
jgi:hypothetical protein